MSESTGWVEWAKSYATPERVQNALGWAKQNVPPEQLESLRSAASREMSRQMSQPNTSAQQGWAAWAWEAANSYMPGYQPPPEPPATAPEAVHPLEEYIPVITKYWFISVPVGLWMVSVILSWLWWFGAIGVVIWVLANKVTPPQAPPAQPKQS